MARGWRNGIVRLAAIALLTTMFFGASAGAASADGLLGGLLGSGNNNDGGGGTGNPVGGVVTGVTDTIGGTVNGVAGAVGDTVDGLTGNTEPPPSNTNSPPANTDSSGNSSTGLSGVVNGVAGIVTTVVNGVTGNNDVLPSNAEPCVLASCGTQSNPAGTTGANLASTVNNTVQGITGPLTNTTNPSGTTTPAGTTSTESTAASALPLNTFSAPAGDAQGNVTVTVAGIEITDSGFLNPITGPTSLVNNANICLVGCPTGPTTNALATANAATNTVAFIPGLSADACALGACQTPLIGGHGVLLGTLGVQDPNNIVGNTGLGFCIIGQCAAGPNTSFNAIGGLLLNSDGGIVPFIDGVACIVGTCTVNGQAFTGVLFADVQTGDVLGLGPLGGTACVVGVCPGLGTDGPGSPTDPNSPTDPTDPTDQTDPNSPTNPYGPDGSGNNGSNPIPVGMVSPPGSGNGPGSTGGNGGGAGGSGSVGGPGGGMGPGGAGGPGSGGPQSGSGPNMGLPNTGFAPFDTMMDSPATGAMLLGGLFLIIALWAAGMLKVMRRRDVL